MVENSEIIVECSGDVLHAAEVVAAAHAAGRPVVTMGTEFQVTLGSYFCQTGYLTEAEGDQPGSLAALAADVRMMGFRPRVYGNIKGFLNHNPRPPEMAYWAARSGISVEQTVSFTDGTKLQMEQCLVANGCGATIVRRGMLGPPRDDLIQAGNELGDSAASQDRAICDYVLSPKLPAGVFIVAEHPFEKPEVLRYLKLGDGPFYTLLRPFHLCHLEVIKTLQRVVDGRPPLLNNSPDPTVLVAAVVKRAMAAGERIERGYGGYQLRGEAVRIAEAGSAIPIGLVAGARLARKVEAGETLCWNDVELPDRLATRVGLGLRAAAQQALVAA
jgi:predicted homoserine dehydrogenase-like protein